MTRSRRLHRIVGLVLMLPLCGWAVTGVVFFVKPGYGDAYAGLRVKTYPLEGDAITALGPGWREVRFLGTVLGDHLLARDEGGWSHLDPATLEPRAVPDDAELRRLIDDAISDRRDRYGEIATIHREGDSITADTTTGVEISLDWNTLSLMQSGPDTRRIDALYRIHYLQWTGITMLDRALGVAGLASLVLLTALGVRLAFGRER